MICRVTGACPGIVIVSLTIDGVATARVRALMTTMSSAALRRATESSSSEIVILSANPALRGARYSHWVDDEQ